MKSYISKIAIFLASIFMLMGCDTSETTSETQPDPSSEIEIESINAQSTTLSQLSTYNTYKFDEVVSNHSVKNKNLKDVLDKTFYSVLENNNKVFQLDIKLKNPKKEAITAIEFGCEDENAEIELQDSKGESKWFLLKDYSIAEWGGTNRYERSFNLRLSEEYLKETCELIIKDIEVNGEWINKKLNKNTLMLLIDESEIFRFVRKEINYTTRELYFNYEVSDKVNEVNIISAEKHEDGVFSAKEGSIVKADIEAKYGELEVKLQLEETIKLDKLNLSPSYQFYPSLITIDVITGERLDHPYYAINLFLHVYKDSVIGTGFNFINPTVKIDNKEMIVLEHSYFSFDPEYSTFFYLLEVPSSFDNYKMHVFQNIDIEINATKISLEWGAGTNFYSEEGLMDKYSLILDCNSAVPSVLEIFNPTDNENEFIIEDYPINSNLTYFSKLNVGKDFFNILDVNVEGDFSYLFDNNYTDEVDRTSYYGVYDLILNINTNTLEFIKTEASEITYSYFEEGGNYLPRLVYVGYENYSLNEPLTFNSETKMFEILNLKVERSEFVVNNIPLGHTLYNTDENKVYIPEASKNNPVNINFFYDPINVTYTYTII